VRYLPDCTKAGRSFAANTGPVKNFAQKAVGKNSGRDFANAPKVTLTLHF
jgi:hypothetical protein